MPQNDIFSLISDQQHADQYQKLHWQGSFEEYLALVQDNPNVSRSAFQRVYDMIMSYGSETYEDGKKKITKYHFFSDPINEGKDAIFGLDISLQKLVSFLKSAANRYGTEKRVLLLHGPVGSSKSTVARLIKKGLEVYSKTEEGVLYTYAWVIKKSDFPDDMIIDTEEFVCPMNQDPLLLIPKEFRSSLEEKLNARGKASHEILIEGDLNPACRQIFAMLMKHYDGDWMKVVGHVQVRRLVLSERDRVGIGTFQPKDEKNQDSTELTGDINYRKIAYYGSDSDPRAFNFDGEFNIANRGVIEFVEVLKLDVAFLYDLLGASQEHKIKPKKFPQTDIDEFIIGHTNEPEYRKLQNNEFMEALRDRTVKIDIPYITKWSEEIKIYKKDYDQKRIAKHIAPHTLEMAALWAVLTRLEEPKKANLTLLQKLKLYDGQVLPGYTEENIRELRKETTREGLDGVSPRYVQDKISNALVDEHNEHGINPFMVLNELDAGLKSHSLISNEEERKRYRELIGVVKQEYEDVVKNEVQRAICADEEQIAQLCGNYIDHVKAYTQNETVRNAYTGSDDKPDERLMRAIEEKIDIPEARKDDFRKEIMNYIGALAVENRSFDYKTNDRLHRALELKLFEDQKDSIKLTSLVSSVVDKDTQAKIDVVKQRLMNNYGYNQKSASDVLHFVASIFARGEAKKQ